MDRSAIGADGGISISKSLPLVASLTILCSCGPTAADMEELDHQSSALSAWSAIKDWTDSTGTIHLRSYQCYWIGPAQHNQTTCPVEDNQYVLVGGGAEIEGQGSPGALLTSSFPGQSGLQHFWSASSKDHLVAYAHRLRAYAIGLRLDGLSRDALASMTVYNSSISATASHPSAEKAKEPGDTILIGGGALAHFSGAGQLLTGSYPVPDPPAQPTAWHAASKDHLVGDPGTVEAWAISIPRCPTGYVGGCLGVTVISFGISPVGPGYAGGFSGEPASNPPPFLLTTVGGKDVYNGQGRMLTQLFPDTPLNTFGEQGAWILSKDHQVGDTGHLVTYMLNLSKFP